MWSAMSLSALIVKPAGREFGFVDNRNRRSSRGNGGFFVGSIGPSRLGRKNRRKEKRESERKAVKTKRMKGKDLIL